METEKMLMEQRELKRWHLMELVEAKKITLGVTEQQGGATFETTRYY